MKLLIGEKVICDSVVPIDIPETKESATIESIDTWVVVLKSLTHRFEIMVCDLKELGELKVGMKVDIKYKLK